MREVQFVFQTSALLQTGSTIHIIEGSLVATDYASGWRENELTTFSTPHIPSFEPHYLISIYFSCMLPLTPRSCRKYTCPLATEGFTLGQHTNNDPWLQGIRIEGILPLGPQGNTIRRYHYKHGHTKMETVKTHRTTNLTFTSTNHPELSTPTNQQ
jgi:hypothetical protein